MKFYNLLPLFAVIVLSSKLPAQTLTGTVTTIPTARPWRARVTLFNADTSWFWETRTDAAGQYLFENLPGGGACLVLRRSQTRLRVFSKNATTGILGTIVPMRNDQKQNRASGMSS
ncbi:MAG: carboxypeptidase regulatory-like domain-containing protein [Lewinellaceae bacterium]|nr:carboxypeptidase regulatory-like domain-containing protein [Lewinellaceae bacterium]